MKKKHSVAFALLVLLSGCVNTSAVQLGTPGQFPPTDPEQVQVFLTEADVKVPFEKVALINAEGNYQYANDERMIKAMKKKAAELGANAIIIGEFKDPSTASKVANAVLGVGGERKGQVLAVRLQAAAAQVDSIPDLQ